ncbi:MULTISPECIES: thiamine phosphate synthase [unclassified Polaribacter]|uniref:thiamine phosphate synthase n=1 Tax=unclassified Polaribacter TaxID=196858 RepID=UPI0011BE8130|nr:MULTISPECIES: thiamine phosphate synthase [unclassified Polaribacter]TXD50742.1 thiamine phosphate synthase [Polaribacter sp. IC063]TXD57407.1 thiamine phosphate synthase [Polaribacter sp. IC066]
MIPKLHYLSQGSSPKEHLENIQKACSAGTELVQLRLKNISEKKCLKFAEEAREITSHFQTRLIINSHYKVAKKVKADGVHLETSDVCPIIARTHIYTWQIIGATANTIQECETVISKQVDYIGLSPFKGSKIKENLEIALGLNGYRAILDVLKTDTPIIGMGGIIPEDVKDILETGISGIGVSDAITADFNSVKLFNELLSASATEEQRHTF